MNSAHTMFPVGRSVFWPPCRTRVFISPSISRMVSSDRRPECIQDGVIPSQAVKQRHRLRHRKPEVITHCPLRVRPHRHATSRPGVLVVTQAAKARCPRSHPARAEPRPCRPKNRRFPVLRGNSRRAHSSVSPLWHSSVRLSVAWSSGYHASVNCSLITRRHSLLAWCPSTDWRDNDDDLRDHLLMAYKPLHTAHLKRSSPRPNRNQDIISESRITTGARLPHSHPGEPCEPSANASA